MYSGNHLAHYIFTAHEGTYGSLHVANCDAMRGEQYRVVSQFDKFVSCATHLGPLYQLVSLKLFLHILTDIFRQLTAVHVGIYDVCQQFCLCLSASSAGHHLTATQVGIAHALWQFTVCLTQYRKNLELGCTDRRLRLQFHNDASATEA